MQRKLPLLILMRTSRLCYLTSLNLQKPNCNRLTLLGNISPYFLKNKPPNGRFLLLVHGIEELVVVLGLAHLVQEEFHRIDGAHRVEDTAQDPHLLQRVLVDQQFLLAGAGFLDVDGREDAFVGDLAFHDDLGITGAFEFFEDDLVHAAAGVDQRGGDNSKTSTLFDVTRGAEETFRALQSIGVHTPGQDLTG